MEPIVDFPSFLANPDNKAVFYLYKKNKEIFGRLDKLEMGGFFLHIKIFVLTLFAKHCTDKYGKYFCSEEPYLSQ